MSVTSWAAANPWAGGEPQWRIPRLSNASAMFDPNSVDGATGGGDELAQDGAGAIAGTINDDGGATPFPYQGVYWAWPLFDSNGLRVQSLASRGLSCRLNLSLFATFDDLSQDAWVGFGWANGSDPADAAGAGTAGMGLYLVGQGAQLDNGLSKWFDGANGALSTDVAGTAIAGTQAVNVPWVGERGLLAGGALDSAGAVSANRSVSTALDSGTATPRDVFLWFAAGFTTNANNDVALSGVVPRYRAEPFPPGVFA